MRLGAIKESRSRPNRETWKESGLHIERGQITTLRTNPGCTWFALRRNPGWAAYRKWADHDFKKEFGLHMICLKKESRLHLESGQITIEAHPGAYGKKIKEDLITYQIRYGCILGEISKWATHNGLLIFTRT